MPGRCVEYVRESVRGICLHGKRQEHEGKTFRPVHGLGDLMLSWDRRLPSVMVRRSALVPRRRIKSWRSTLVSAISCVKPDHSAITGRGSLALRLSSINVEIILKSFRIY